jgi:hypothetical protein
MHRPQRLRVPHLGRYTESKQLKNQKFTQSSHQIAALDSVTLIAAKRRGLRQRNPSPQTSL